MVLNSGSDEWFIMSVEIVGFLYFAFMFGYVASTRSSAAYALLQHRVSSVSLQHPFLSLLVSLRAIIGCLLC